jgi:hypothetical protein
MRGKNITNVYIIDEIAFKSKELTNAHLEIIETYENRTLYNNFRNKLLEEKGDDVECTIKIIISDNQVKTFIRE